MTASGPMAQGPGGPPKTWGARPTAGASGAAVMAASRAGTLNQMLDDDEDASDLEVDDDPYDEAGGLRFKAVDLNDIGSAEKRVGDDGMAPLTLPRDPKVLRTKIRRLQERKQERLKKEAARAKSEAGVKAEPQDDSLPGSGTSTPATAATPAPLDSKEGSLALMSVDEDKEAKDLKDLEEEEKKEIILSEAFDLAPETRGELYMFQFPRKFPEFVPSSSVKSESHPSGDLASLSIKPDPDAPAPRKVAPPPWGRFGTRTEKAARWSEHEGRIGELCVHRSGKVTLRLEGDLRYEVLPAAQPSFLQEIAVLDHPSRNAATNGTSKKPKSRRRSSSTSSSSSSSSSSDSPSSSKTPALPADSLVVLGQTSKKFIVVPQIEDLLEKVGEQEKKEREEERRLRMEKAKKEGGVKREGKR
ncbi:RNA polymerase III RPC4-domain containing protein [Rhodotorula toruloides]|nr:RNA polymerase III RPC4-domain containing protein [Rhodotorula toruloides]